MSKQSNGLSKYIEQVNPLAAHDSIREKQGYISYVLGYNISALNDFVEKHKDVPDSEYCYSANLLYSVLKAMHQTN